MRSEIIAVLTDLLKSETFGINAQLAVLPIDPEDDRPIVSLILNGTTDETLLKGEQFDRGVDILVIVTTDGPTTTRGGPASTEMSRGTTPVAVIVVHRGERGTVQRYKDCDHVMRAITLSLQTAFWLREGAVTKRNDVQVIGASTLTYSEIQDTANGSVAGVVFSIDALDKRAQTQKTVL